jgi:steroid delta-isomerase-like uncharacterized protein
MEDLIREYLKRVNAEDVDGTLELWHEDCVFNVPFQGTLRGKEALRGFYCALPKAYSQHKDEMLDIVVDGNKVAVRILVDNTTHDGKVIKFEAIDWMTLEDGKIKSVAAFFDTAKVLKDMKG